MKESIPVKDKFLLTINEASEYFNIGQKILLTINEASEYFNIGQKNMRRIAENHLDSFGIFQGNRFLIIRSRFEEYIISCLKTEEGGKSL